MKALTLPFAHAAAVLAHAGAADDARPAFEVASIRLHQGPVTKVDLSISGSRVTVFAYTTAELIGDAYNLKEYQVAGIAGWAGADRYDIAAKAEGDDELALDKIRPLLQTLLADRFQLQTHRETREMPVYQLVIGKTGPKLRENTVHKDGVPLAKIGQEGRNAAYTFTAAPVSLLATLLPRMPGVDRPVFDKTGLTSRYDFQPDSDRLPPRPRR